MIQLNILELAKQGDTNAINTLVSQWLNLPTITPKTSFKQNCLQIMLESFEVPVQELVVPLICDGLINSSINYFNAVKIYGRVTGEDFPDWQQEIELEALVNSDVLTSQTNIEVESSIAITKTTKNNKLTVKKQSFWDSLFEAVAGTAEVVGGAAVQGGQAATGAAIGMSGTIGGAALQAGQAVAGAAVGISGAIGSAAFQASQPLHKVRSPLS